MDLEGIFLLQRFAGAISWEESENKSYYLQVDNAASLDLSGGQFEETEPEAVDEKTIIKVTVKGTEVVTIESKAGTTGSYGAYTGTVTDGNGGIDKDLVFADAASYKIQWAKSNKTITVKEGFGADDSVTGAAKLILGTGTGDNEVSFAATDDSTTLTGTSDGTTVSVAAMPGNGKTIEVKNGTLKVGDDTATIGISGGSGKVGEDGAITELTAGSTVTGAVVGASVTTAGAGTFTVNDITFETSDSVAVAPSSATKLTVSTLGNGKTLTLAGDSATGDGMTLVFNTAEYDAVKGAVVFTGGSNLEGTTAKLVEGNSVTPKGHDAVSVIAATTGISVDANGVVSGFTTDGGTVKIGEVTYTLAKQDGTAATGTLTVSKDDGTTLGTATVTYANVKDLTITDVEGSDDDKIAGAELDPKAIVVNSGSVGKKYGADGWVVTTGEKVTVTENEGKYTITLGDTKVTKGIVIDGVVANVTGGTSTGLETVFTMGTGDNAPTFTAAGTFSTDEKGNITVSDPSKDITVTKGTLNVLTGETEKARINGVVFNSKGDAITTGSYTTGTSGIVNATKGNVEITSGANVASLTLGADDKSLVLTTEDATVGKFAVGDGTYEVTDFTAGTLATAGDAISATGKTGGTITFTSETEATDLKNVTVTLMSGSKITGEVESAENNSTVAADSTKLTLTSGVFKAIKADALNIGTGATKDATVKVDDVTFKAGTDASATGTYTKGDGSAIAAVLSITAAGDSLTAEAKGISLTVGSKAYKTAVADETTIVYNATANQLTAGSVELTKAAGLLQAGSTAAGFITNTNADKAIVVSSAGVVSKDTMTEGVSFTTKDANDGAATTYTVLNGNLIVSDGTNVKAYSTWTSVTMKIGEGSLGDEVVGKTEAAATNIVVKPTETTTAGAHYYSANGIELPSETGKAVTVTYTGTGASATAAVSVGNVTVNAKIDMTGAIVTTVTDTNKKATYLIGTSEFSGTGFTTAVVEGNTEITGAVTALTGNGTYYLGEKADSTTVTFVEYGGTGVTLPNGATIKLKTDENGVYTDVVVKEKEATADVTATVIKGDGTITGLDKGATVTANSITATTATNDNPSLKVVNGGIETVDNTNKITFTEGSSGSFTFTGSASATELKGVTATITGAATVVGAKGTTESLAGTTGGTVTADANGDLTITATGTYTTVENGEIAVDAGGNVTVNTTGSPNGVTFVKGGETVTGTYTGSTTAKNVKATLTSTDAADGLTAATAGAVLTVHGTEYTTAVNTTTILYGTGTAQLSTGSVILEQGESIFISDKGTLTNNGNTAIQLNYDQVNKKATIKAADGTDLQGGESFTTVDATGTFTVKYTLDANASKVTVQQKNGNVTTTAVYEKGTKIAVEMKNGVGAFTGNDITQVKASDELSGVNTSTAKEVELEPIADMTKNQSFDKNGKPTDSASDADTVITVNGTTTPKTVTVTGAVDSSVPIDLTGANAKVTDSGSNASYQLDGSTLSGTSFAVNNNVITDTGSNGVKVASGSVTTSAAAAKVDMSAGYGHRHLHH